MSARVESGLPAKRRVPRDGPIAAWSSLMNLISTLIGLVALIAAIVGLIPLLGWLNWFVIPVVATGLVLGVLSDETTGRNINLVVLAIAAASSWEAVSSKDDERCEPDQKVTGEEANLPFFRATGLPRTAS